MKTWVIADLHLNHQKIQVYEPTRLAWGATCEAMTETIIQAWIATVALEDTVIVVGDMFMGMPDLMASCRARLPGKIVLIRGNHDRKPHIWLTNADEMHDVLEMGSLIFRHDPHDFTEDEADRASVLIHGHIHTGEYRVDTPMYVRRKARCVSIEVLPTRPAPMLLAVNNFGKADVG